MCNACYICWDFQVFTLKCRSSLPNPDGPLSKVTLSEGILLSNKDILEAEDNCLMSSGNTSGRGHSHGPYEHFTIDEKAKYVV